MLVRGKVAARGNLRKLLGDALVLQGRKAEAAAQYDAAIERSPQWGEPRGARAALGDAVG